MDNLPQNKIKILDQKMKCLVYLSQVTSHINYKQAI